MQDAHQLKAPQFATRKLVNLFVEQRGDVERLFDVFHRLGGKDAGRFGCIAATFFQCFANGWERHVVAVVPALLIVGGRGCSVHVVEDDAPNGAFPDMPLSSLSVGEDGFDGDGSRYESSQQGFAAAVGAADGNGFACPQDEIDRGLQPMCLVSCNAVFYFKDFLHRASMSFFCGRVIFPVSFFAAMLFL